MQCRHRSVRWWIPTLLCLVPACAGNANESGATDDVGADNASGNNQQNSSPQRSEGPVGSASTPFASSSESGAAIGSPSEQGSSSNDNGDAPTDTQPANSSPSSSNGQMPTNAPPSAVCSGALPASFTNLCSGCHTVSGTANERYPDLYAFSGDEATFISRVRSGGGAMLAYSAEVIADEDLKTAYAYFTSNPRTTARTDFGDMRPLFTAADATHPAVSFVRDDGVLITRGAGRVRQRHELEGTFNPYGPHYFEDRSFGILVEDHTVIGESLIRVSYLPAGQPTAGTNFRAWKIYGEGNVFHANMGMDTGVLPALAADGLDLSTDYTNTVAPYAAIQVQQTTTNSRTGEPIAVGDVFEFEFGVFLEPDAVRESSRTSYYSDTYRYRAGLGGFTPENADPAGQLGPVRMAQQGGAGTNVWLYEDQEFAFEQMALNIQHENVQPFLRGRRLFHTDFDSGEHSEAGNPAFDEQAGKLGPLFVTRSCETCHPHNGPGAPLVTFDETASTAIKLYDAGPLGSQLQLQEGTVTLLATETSDAPLADGTAVKLSRQTLEVTSSAGESLKHSARMARKLIGLGLLEAIDESTLLTRSDPLDCDGDGISGRPALIVDPETKALSFGRFGWKGEKVSVRHQVMDALEGDLGVGTQAIPDSEGQIELEEQDLGDLTAYMRLLSVPAQRDVDDAEVMAGETLFRSIGCAQCHVTDMATGSHHPFAELREQSIKPYTDLLLHDMGEGLADQSGIPSGTDTAPPGAREWRTPPLWGLGSYATVNGNTALLHDGRAATVTEAILWHGGEAADTRERFRALSETQRTALLRFLESL